MKQRFKHTLKNPISKVVNAYIIEIDTSFYLHVETTGEYMKNLFKFCFSLKEAKRIYSTEYQSPKYHERPIWICQTIQNGEQFIKNKRDE